MEAELDEYAKQAHKLVDRVIESSISKLENNGLQKEKTMQSIKFDMSRDTTIVFADPKYEDYDIENIDWLSIEEFTVEKAEEKIYEFIKVRFVFSLDKNIHWGACKLKFLTKVLSRM